jgi:GntR family transcriptional regulator of arabinose operon
VTLDDPLTNPPGVAKYKQIYQLLRQSIDDGTYSAGKRLPSENELVKRLSASRPTIGRAFAQLESEGLIQRRAGSGTFVSSQAAMPHRSFGLLIPDLGVTEIFEPICQGISQGQNGDHHDLIWGPLFDRDASKEIQAERLCEHFLTRRPAGVFFAPLELTERKDETNLRIAKDFEDAGIPLVLLDRDIVEYPKRSRHDVVGIDNHRAGIVMTEHLLDAGARRIVFFARPYSAPTVNIRIMGYRSAMEARGLDKSAQMVCFADPTEASAVEDLLRDQRPDAILCPNDVTAVQLMTTLMRMGMRIPGDVRVTGMDDLKYASLLQVPLTSISQPGLAIGATAMLAMRDRVANPQMPARNFLVDFKLMVRASSKRGVDCGFA